MNVQTERRAPFNSRIPFDTIVTQAMLQGRTVTEHTDGQISGEIELLWEAVVTRLS